MRQAFNMHIIPRYLILTLSFTLVWGCGERSERARNSSNTTTTPKPLCPSEYEEVGDYCYQFNLDYLRSWTESREYCQSIGGDLAVIHECDVLGKIVRHIHITSQEVPEGRSYWIGGTDKGDEGAWFYIDNIPMAMGVPFWGEVNGVHEPSGGEDQNCAQLNHDDRYYIHDGECDNGAYALCQYDVDSVLL